jgi:hypothetical protein
MNKHSQTVQAVGKNASLLDLASDSETLLDADRNDPVDTAQTRGWTSLVIKGLKSLGSAYKYTKGASKVPKLTMEYIKSTPKLLSKAKDSWGYGKMAWTGANAGLLGYEAYELGNFVYEQTTGYATPQAATEGRLGGSSESEAAVAVLTREAVLKAWMQNGSEGVVTCVFANTSKSSGSNAEPAYIDMSDERNTDVFIDDNEAETLELIIRNPTDVERQAGIIGYEMILLPAVENGKAVKTWRCAAVTSAQQHQFVEKYAQAYQAANPVGGVWNESVHAEVAFMSMRAANQHDAINRIMAEYAVDYLIAYELYCRAMREPMRVKTRELLAFRLKHMGY